MEYKGKVYAKIGNKYIECTQSVADLENEIKLLKNGIENFKNWLKNNGDSEFSCTDIIRYLETKIESENE